MKKKESDISNVHLHPGALSKSFSSSAFTFYLFLLGFASYHFYPLQGYSEKVCNFSIEKTAKLHSIIFFSHSLSFLSNSLCTSHFLSLYNVENSRVKGGAIANAARIRLTNTSHRTSISK